MENFSGTKTDITLKNCHTQGYKVYVLYARLQGNIDGFNKWEPHSRAGIYLGHSKIHAGSVAMVRNPTTGHVSPQFNVVFDDDFSTVPLTREVTITPIG